MTLRLRLLAAALVLPLSAAAQQLTVSAAASLTDAFREVGRRFEAFRPGVTVRFNFAASGVLMQQIAQGAPADVFASADQETMDRGVALRLVDAASRRDFAANTLVLIVPARDAPPVEQLADLRQPAIRRVAIGKPATVPVGRYTREALVAAGLWSALEPRLVQADSVRQVLDYVARGETEAGFVYRTDAAVMADKVRIVQTLRDHPPVRYPVAAVADSRHPVLAREFTAFLTGAQAQEVLVRFGFVPP
ncbi:molybdate ABC transporter substrate-binding protein [Piscinibacter sp. XHJ-5]|uniref:molybdate ABC transporter substrate-binding protein n=1 Tax=Piscinibacter sp. XHJ-5 TaxID=3037797 RepID=UPI002452A164|nr:molybdate ABC transporter substrate-binding protein [Piscinibacter sp. XHJ-5]